MSSQRLEGSDLEALLARVRSDFGEEATIVEANKLRKGGVGGFFAKEAYEVVVDVPDVHDVPDVPDVPDDDGEPVALRRPAPRPDPVDEVDDEPFIPFTVEDLASSVQDPAPSFASTPTPAFSEVLAEAIQAERRAALEPAWPAAAALAEAAPAARITSMAPRFEPGGLSGVRVPAAGGLSAADVRALAGLGVPTDRMALPSRTDDPAAVALVRMLSAFPAAPPIPHGAAAVIAVVGERDAAMELATSLTGDEAAVVVAGRQRSAHLRAARDVADLQRGWRRRKRPVVVAVDAPFGIGPSPWAADLVDALEPAMVLAHVEAGRKPEDVVAWSQALGGVDALAVVGIDRTTTPAAVLATGIPVASLDGAAATPARWAALLTDRLALAA